MYKNIKWFYSKIQKTIYMYTDGIYTCVSQIIQSKQVQFVYIIRVNQYFNIINGINVLDLIN